MATDRHAGKKPAALILVTLVLSACAVIEADSTRFCESPSLFIDARFEGGNFFNCFFSAESHASIEIRPENEPPINRSPWYAFRVSARQPTRVTVDLTFFDGYARYWPKWSLDGSSWTALPESSVSFAENGESMSLSLAIDETPVWVAAQELVLPPWYDAWIRDLAAHPEITALALGHSVEGRPIQAAMTSARPEAVFFIGRQHPPEITGAFAMRSFVDTVMSESALAREFRQRFQVIVIPLINPDGVALGHWRHNVNGIDLNRDWGPFTQPETQSVAELLAALEGMHVEPRLMLDFHSTRESLFYTQMPGDLPEDSGEGATDFATEWLNRSRSRLPDFEFKHDPRPPSGQQNTKNYFFSRYGIPAITYEIGDEVDRDAIDASTPIFAEEMMRLMLERQKRGQSP